ncbi:MAG: hypothetical protein HY717_00645 [Planctomycetes bacterium]|nr:hypothetical protein [Planctomycetota bacterium]
MLFQLVLVVISVNGPESSQNPGDKASEKPALAPAHPGPARGRWVLDGEGNPVKPRPFERGLQTSALVFYRDRLWSAGDQRSEYPGRLLEIDPKTARLAGPPIRLPCGESVTPGPLVDAYRGIRNPDYEGLTVHPRKPDTLIAVTEDKQQLIIEIKLAFEGSSVQASIVQITGLEFPPGLAAFKDDPNYRIEGVAASLESPKLYLAWERAKDNRPRIFQISCEEAARGGAVKPAEVPMDFGAVPPRADKPRALLNLNDLQALKVGGKELLLALARDQERMLLLDPEQGLVVRAVDLDFQDPGGEKILWVSPEGLAADPHTKRLWVINDPDSIAGNYRLLKDQSAEGRFADMAPLLFELPWAEVLGEAGR